MPEKEHAAFEQIVLLPLGIKSLISYVNTAQPLPGDEQTRIFDAVRDVYGPWNEARKTGAPHSLRPFYDRELLRDYNRLVWSYAPAVAGAAYELLRPDSRTSLDDLFQSGVVGLYKAVELYSIKEERLAFAPYAGAIVKSYMRQQLMRGPFGQRRKKWRDECPVRLSCCRARGRRGRKR